MVSFLLLPHCSSVVRNPDKAHRETWSPVALSGSWLQRKGKQSHNERELRALTTPYARGGKEAPRLVPEPAHPSVAPLELDRHRCCGRVPSWFPPTHPQGISRSIPFCFHDRLDEELSATRRPIPSPHLTGVKDMAEGSLQAIYISPVLPGARPSHRL